VSNKCESETIVILVMVVTLVSDSHLLETIFGQFHKNEINIKINSDSLIEPY